jgi:protocatechuate 3,4-dioxygenase, alpha subunit
VSEAQATPGQTVGPFFGTAMPYAGGPELVPAAHPGAVRLHGVVLDGNGVPVPDALLEIWQPDATGRPVSEAGSLQRDGWTFTGWGRASTDGAGEYSFTTLAPGSVGPGRVPFIAMTVFARGLLDRLLTRVYLPGGDVDHAADPWLAQLPAERRATLIAAPDADGYRFDVVLQGANETVFVQHAL